MNSVPQHLLSEDRRAYERILDEALRSAPHRPELAAVGQRLNTEQLRTMALNATALITAAAATEYQHYVKVREGFLSPGSGHSPSPATSSPAAPSQPGTWWVMPPPGSRPTATDRRKRASVSRRFGAAVLGARHPGDRRAGSGVAPQRWARMSYGRRLLAAVLGLHVRPEAPASLREPSQMPTRRPRPDRETREATRTNAFAALPMVMLMLSGSAAAIFLTLGYVLLVTGIDTTLARTMLGAAWLFVALAAGMIVINGVILLVTALRGNRSGPEAEGEHERQEVVRRAKQVWLEALLERGIVPFLREALANPGAAPLDRTKPLALPRRLPPRLGYNRPGFSSPDRGPAAAPQPSYVNPDYSSSESEVQEHQPE
ncbi:hypothetical protein GCM10010372_83560 [Streptomyces tauricus]|uniref:hypothetical protein n=1 Tax=Streptomyces tauricus TaxID=68274 RepID=UPI0019C0F78B|nr:hypothetical protein [Streptomyces tauricus]GHA71916.1 hypothetical protein GCM10010372_83560 [Streptomyces tauricus]